MLLSSPPEGWCWCVAWEVETWDGWLDRTAEENRQLREQLWSEGEYHGYLFYVDRESVGWARVGPTSVWKKLCESRDVEASDSLFVFTCFGMRPSWRRKGLLHRFLPMVLKDLARSGVSELVAFPRRAPKIAEDGRLWNGPAAIFEKAGFTITRTTDEYFEMRRSLSNADTSNEK